MLDIDKILRTRIADLVTAIQLVKTQLKTTAKNREKQMHQDDATEHTCKQKV